MDEKLPVVIKEQFILQKYNGDPLPENEFERITFEGDRIVSHERIENGVPVGPVLENNLAGQEVD